MNRKVSLREVSERVDYGLTTSAVLNGEGPRFLRITDIDASFIDWATVPRCEASAADVAKYALADGDVVVARTGASTGRSQWVQVYESSVFASYLVRFRVRPDISSRFIGYVLNSTAWFNHVASVAHGKSAQPNMSASEMARFEFECPQLSDQQAIADVLGALDDKIASNTKAAATASTLASLVYDRATIGLQTTAMSDVLTPVLGGTPARSRPDFWGGQEFWASAKDITGADFGVVTNTVEKITASAIAETKAKPLPTGSVILTARGTVGAVARFARPSSFNQSCYGFVPGRIPSGVLYFSILRSTQRAKEIAHGSVFDTITMKTFDHLAFPVFDEQQLTATESQIAPLLDLVAGLVVESEEIAGLRDALLPQLMSGKLRVKDAERALEDAGV